MIRYLLLLVVLAALGAWAYSESKPGTYSLLSAEPQPAPERVEFVYVRPPAPAGSYGGAGSSVRSGSAYGPRVYGGGPRYRK